MRLLFPLLLALLHFTQEVVAQQLRWGIEYGIGHSSLNYVDPGLDLGRETERFVFNAGVFTEKDVSKSISAQLGFRYSLYGNDIRVEFFGNTPYPGFIQKRLHHLSLPTRIRYRPFHTPFYVLAGYQIGYIILLETNDLIPGGIDPSYWRLRYIDFIDRYNVSFTAGFGYRKKVDDQTVIFQALYDRGIGSLGKWKSEWKVQGILIQTGFVF